MLGRIATGKDIAEGYGISRELAEKIVRVSQRVGIPNPAMLANAIYYESGFTFSPSIVHHDPRTGRSSGATGLIQFLPSVASELGTTTTALQAMSAVDQMDYVEKYFMLPRIRQGCPEPWGKQKRATGPSGCNMSFLPYKDQPDVYAAIFYPPGRRNQDIQLTGEASVLNIAQSPAAYNLSATSKILARGVPQWLGDPEGRLLGVALTGALAAVLLGGGFLFWLSVRKKEKQ